MRRELHLRLPRAFGDARLRAWLWAACFAFAACPATAARLEYTGPEIARAGTAAALAKALRAPGDSARLVAGLGDAVARLQDLGYLEATADGSWRPAAPGEVQLDVHVTPGRRLRLATVEVRALSRADSAAFALALPLARGEWASPRAVGDAVERALAVLSDAGYPYAVLGVGGWGVDSSGVQLALSGGLGPKVMVSGSRFPGARTTSPRFLERAMGRVVGLPYNRSAAEAGRERLESLGLFRRVDYEGLEGEADWTRGVVVYRVEEPTFHRFEGVIGTQGEGRVVGLANVELQNLAGTGREAALRWESRGRGVSWFSARYGEPLSFGLPLALEGRLEQQLQDTLYTRTRWSAVARYALSATRRLEVGYEQDRVVQPAGAVREAGTRSTRFALARRTFSPRRAPRRGSVLSLAGTQGFKTERLRAGGGRSSRSSAFELGAELHRPVGGRSGIMIDARVAGRTSSQSVLPDYERHPLGGAASLRGYDEEAFRVDRYGLSRLEWRWFPGNDGAHGFLFWDHATMWTRVADASGGHAETLQRDGYGFGVSLDTAAGEVRVDYGLAPGRGPLEGKLHVRLASGF